MFLRIGFSDRWVGWRTRAGTGVRKAYSGVNALISWAGDFLFTVAMKTETVISFVSHSDVW
jgi:hypothetical protein